MEETSTTTTTTTTESPNTIEVKFVTKLSSEFQVTDRPFRVPVDLSRFGLSGVINHLLNLTPSKPFDFLIENEFLRVSLAEYLKQHNLSQEGLITLEYTEAVKQPDLDNHNPQPDWVSSVRSFEHGYVTGCYDGIVRYINNSDKTLVSTVASTKPIKAISKLSQNDSSITIASGSMDSLIRIFELPTDESTETNDLAPTYICEGHTAGVEAILSSNANSFFSASVDKSIKLWKLNDESLRQASSSSTSSTTQSKKKRKTNEEPKSSPTITLAPASTMTEHASTVTSLCWLSPNEIVSGSYDHSLKIWDIEQQKSTKTLQSGSVIFDVQFNPILNLLASGHSDNHIRLWDPRKEDGSLVTKTLASHKGFVTALSWNSKFPYILASVSHDSTVKLWDIRSNIPLHTLRNHTDKVFCVDFTRNGDVLLSGSADAKVNRWKLNLNA